MTAYYQFAGDIVFNAKEEYEADVRVDRLDITTKRYKMKIGPDQTNMITNNPNGFQREIKTNAHRLKAVENFTYP